MIKKVFFCALLAIGTIQLKAQVSIVPLPAEVSMPATAGSFTLTAATPIIVEGSGMKNSIDFFNLYLKQVYGFTLKESKGKGAGIHLNFERMDKAIPGAYTLQVKQD